MLQGSPVYGLKRSILEAVMAPAGSSYPSKENMSPVATVEISKKVEDVKDAVESMTISEADVTTSTIGDSHISFAELCSWFRAVRLGNLEEVKKKAELNPALLNVAPIHNRWAAVHVATNMRNPKMLQLLNKLGANFNATTLMHHSCLHLAALLPESSDLIRILLSYGVNPNVRDVTGYLYHHYIGSACMEDVHHFEQPLKRDRLPQSPRPLTSHSVNSSFSIGSDNSMRKVIKGIFKI